MATNIEINVPNSSGTYSAYYPKTSIGNIAELARKKSTTYAIHDVAYHASLPAGRFLECTTAGTTSNSNLTLSSITEGTTTTDGTVVWTVRKINGIFTTANLVAYNTNPLRLKTSTHGIIFRLDQAAFYILLTDANDPDGNFNDFRPIRIDLTTGKCYIDGNASTANALKNAREIDGVTFDGAASVAHYAPCTTAAATTEKTVLCTNFKLVFGARITIKFGSTNTANNPTLNVNSTGAKPIYYRGSNIPTEKLVANHVYEFVYNGTNYELVGDLDTTYSAFVKSGATAKEGLVPKPLTSADKTLFLCEDGTWKHVMRCRRANSDYTIGEVVCDVTRYPYPPYQLVCLKSGTTLDGDLPAKESNPTALGSIIYDGTVVWGIDKLCMPNPSEHHNSVCRSADITAYYESGLLSTNIRANQFLNVYPGDYIIKTVSLAKTTYTDKAGTSVTLDAVTYEDVKWIVVGIESFKFAVDSNQEFINHHIVLMPAKTPQRYVKMNPTASTEGGYLGSDMWRIHIPRWATAIKNAFGSSHVLTHQEYLSNSVNMTAVSGGVSSWTGSVNGLIETSVDVNIPNEQMMVGSRVYGSGYDCGNIPTQFPYFAMRQTSLGYEGSGCWLRTVASHDHFVITTAQEPLRVASANAEGGSWGINPYFLFY